MEGRVLKRGSLWSALSLILCAYVALQTISEIRSRDTTASTEVRFEALYLPHPEAIKALSFGYTDFFAHLLWFDTISYFGKHYRQDQSYPWLYHMCNLVTELNPSLLHVYSFCGTMLSWEAKDTDRSLSILAKGMNALPQSWELPYLYGFTSYYFKKDAATAGRYFVEASHKKNAPEFLTSLAAKTISVDDPDEAVSFLRRSIENMEEGEGKEALRKKLAKIISTRDIPMIEAAAAKYKEKLGVFPQSISQLFALGLLSPKLARPGPGKYIINEGKVAFEYGMP